MLGAPLRGVEQGTTPAGQGDDMTLVTQLPSAVVAVDAEVARKVAAAPPGAMTELRLALVCDGGVSLAIYMHGVTKELEQLVRASRAFEKVVAGADDAVVRGALTPIQQVYFDALLAQPAGTRMTVTLDVISGTSAGGINGR